MSAGGGLIGRPRPPGGLGLRPRPERAIPRPPNPASSSSHRRSNGSTAASRARQDSSSTARAGGSCPWSRGRRRVALLRGGRARGLEGLARQDPRQGVRHTQGSPRDHRGVALVGLGSLAGEQPGGAAGGEAGRSGRPQTDPRGARLTARTLCCGTGRPRRACRQARRQANSASSSASLFAGQGRWTAPPVAVDRAGPVGGLADVWTGTAAGPGRWRFHGGILPVVVRPDGLPLGTHITSRGCARHFPSAVGAARHAGAAPNRPLEQRDVRPCAAPDRRPVLGCALPRVAETGPG